MIRSFILALLLVWCLPAFAQQADDAATGFDFEAWETLSTRAEEIVDTAEASSPALETLRASLSEARAAALQVQADNEPRVSNLTAQLEALGPLPAEGEIEPAEIAERRAELSDQLANAKAPVLAAQEIHQHALGLIGEIDAIIRARQKDLLLTEGPSPLNPAHWPTAFEAFNNYLFDVIDEFGSESEAAQELESRRLPISMLLGVIGLVLLTRARAWIMTSLRRYLSKVAIRPSNEIKLLASTLYVILPMLGIWVLVAAIDYGASVGQYGTVVLRVLPEVVLAIAMGRWLGVTLLNTSATAPRFLELDTTEGRAGRKAALWMGIALALSIVLRAIAAQTGFPPEAHVVAIFPVVVLGGVAVFRTGNLLNLHRHGANLQSAERRLQNSVLRILASAAMIAGALGPILSALGYLTASTSFVFPTIMTLGLIGTLTIAFSIINGFAAMILKMGAKNKTIMTTRTATEALVSAGIGFVMICIGLPVFALIWGARNSDLLEVWTRLGEGVEVGGSRISLYSLLIFVVIFFVGYVITSGIKSTLRTTVLPNTKMDSGGRNAVLSGTGYVGVVLALLAAVSMAGIDLSSLAIVAGALSLGIGFGLQSIVSNFVSGIILLIERPIKEGDWVEVGGFSGNVRSINVRSTEITTFDRATVILPNADLISGAVTNWTHRSIQGRTIVPVGVSYDSDPREIERILLEIARSNPKVMVDPAPSVIFQGFGADSMDFEIRAILYDVGNMLSARSEMNFEIARRFAEEGIEIPYAQRDINLRNVDALRGVLSGKTEGDAGE